MASSSSTCVPKVVSLVGENGLKWISDASPAAVRTKVADRNNIQVECSGAVFTVVHSLSGERKVFELACDQFEEVYDDDGDGCIVAMDSAGTCVGVMVFADLFSKVVLVDKEGNMFWRQASDRTAVAVPLELEACRYKDAVLDIPNANNGGSFKCASYVFSRPRSCRQYTFWNLVDLYGFFQLECYGKSGSAWVSRSLDAWLRVFGVFGQQVIDGTMVNGKNAKKRDAPFSGRCLPSPAVSTLGLLSLCHSFATHRGRGASGNSVNPELASELLLRLIDASSHASMEHWHFVL
jgi:hypothetical protein